MTRPVLLITVLAEFSLNKLEAGPVWIGLPEMGLLAKRFSGTTPNKLVRLQPPPLC